MDYVFMKISDIENIYYDKKIIYVDKNGISDALKTSGLKYIHCPKIYSYERLGYAYVFVGKFDVCILSNLNSKDPFISEQSNDVYDYIKNGLSIKFTDYDISDDVIIFGYNSTFMQAKDLEKLHDLYFRGYLDSDIAASKIKETITPDGSIKKESPDSKTKNEFIDSFILIMAGIGFGVCVFGVIYLMFYYIIMP